MTDFSIESLAEDALLLRFGDGIDVATNARVHEAARFLRKASLPGLVDVAPAYATLLLRFDRFARDSHFANGLSPERFSESVRAALPGSCGDAPDIGLHLDDGHQAGSQSITADRVVEIPVCYGGAHGPDIAAVATHADLTTDEVAARHAAVLYTVAMLGFAPGFPYLLGLDTALQLPRRTDPRTRVPAGSVAIGGAQTGIYPRELPGGWHLIGRTPSTLFDPARHPPCLLAPGDRVRFRAIDPGEFTRLKERRG